jgi:hypothetical protein
VRAPFDVEDTVGSSATYRCENAFACPIGELVIPVWQDRVVLGRPRQAAVDPVVIHGYKLRITIRRQVHTRVIRVVEAESKRECDKGYAIIGVVADVSRARHDTAAYLNYGKTCARYRRWRRRRSCRG